MIIFMGIAGCLYVLSEDCVRQEVFTPDGGARRNINRSHTDELCMHRSMVWSKTYDVLFRGLYYL